MGENIQMNTRLNTFFSVILLISFCLPALAQKYEYCEQQINVALRDSDKGYDYGTFQSPNISPKNLGEGRLEYLIDKTTTYLVVVPKQPVTNKDQNLKKGQSRIVIFYPGPNH